MPFGQIMPPTKGIEMMIDDQNRYVKKMINKDGRSLKTFDKLLWGRISPSNLKIPIRESLDKLAYEKATGKNDYNQTHPTEDFRDKMYNGEDFDVLTPESAKVLGIGNKMRTGINIISDEVTDWTNYIPYTAVFGRIYKGWKFGKYLFRSKPVQNTIKKGIVKGSELISKYAAEKGINLTSKEATKIATKSLLGKSAKSLGTTLAEKSFAETALKDAVKTPYTKEVFNNLLGMSTYDYAKHHIDNFIDNTELVSEKNKDNLKSAVGLGSLFLMGALNPNAYKGAFDKGIVRSIPRVVSTASTPLVVTGATYGTLQGLDAIINRDKPTPKQEDYSTDTLFETDPNVSIIPNYEDNNKDENE